MAGMASSRPGRESETKSPLIRRMLAEAEAARDAGDLNAALDIYREGLSLAPMSRELREAFADTLMMAAERKRNRRAASKSSAVLDVAPVAEERPRARIEEEMEQPPRREARRRPESREVPLPRRESSPRVAKPVERERVREEPRTARRPMPSRRAWTMAALYTGICLMLLGVAQALISSAIEQVPLPEVPAVTEVMPPALVEILNTASEDLAARQPDKAVERLEAARLEYPAHSELVETALARSLRAQGNLLLDKMEYEKAAETFERATRVDPLNADNWIELGRAWREHGRRRQTSSSEQAAPLLAKARNAYERALELRRDDPAALIGLAQTAAFQNDRNRAVSLYERVVASAPESSEAGLARRNLQQLTGRN